MIWKLQSTFWSDSVLPRDGFTITPHFEDAGVGSDPQGLCDDLANALASWSGMTHQVTVKAYDAQGSKPVFPQGAKTVNAGAAPASPMPREIALCLSFYSQQNIPRKRGRLYIPGPLLGTSADVRPSGAHMDRVMSLGPILSDLGGVDVDWVVFSRADGVARPVSNYWVDNEWDTVRSRGLRPTGRLTATTSE